MEYAAGGFNPNLEAMSSSTLGFEWSFGSGGTQDREVVLVRCDHAVQRGVPTPVAFDKIQPRREYFDERASAAIAPNMRSSLKKHFGKDAKDFECQYLGVLHAEGNVDADAQAEAGSQLVFEWEVQTDYGVEVYTTYMKYELVQKMSRMNPPKLHMTRR